MTTRRPTRHLPTPQPQPLLSHSTLTFLGHWRGQLLITTIVLFIGFIYFIIRDPIERWRQGRLERNSAKARGALLALENEKEEDTSVAQVVGDRGRAGKRDGKRRKGSLLRVGDGSTGNSSLEGSPAPSSVEKPGGGRNRQSSVSQEVSTIPTPNSVQTPTPISKNKGKSKATSKATIPTPEIRLKKPAEEEVTQVESELHIAKEETPLPQHQDAWTVPLPSSPFAGPSRLTLPPRSTSSISTDGRSDVDSSDARDELNGDIEENRLIGDKERRSSQGFSIFPEDGYLPPSALSSGKKKKRGKGKAGASSTPIAQVETSSNHTTSNGHTPSPSRARSTSSSQPLSHIPESSSVTSPPPTPRRAHSRKASLGVRPFGVDSEELLLEREKTIDALRAEIGEAKAEEAKAREEVERCRKTEELGVVELERVRRACGKVEYELKRRENDLQRQLTHTTQLAAAQSARLAVIEQFMISHGIQPPPPPSPHPNPLSSYSMNGSNRDVSMPSSPSPYPLGYPSPMSNGNGNGRSPMLIYPSPNPSMGIFAHAQSQASSQQQPGMLHPNTIAQHQYNLGLIHQSQMMHLHHTQQSQQQPQSPGGQHQQQPLSPTTPFRRASNVNEPDHPLAGALTPGVGTTYPDHLGNGRPRQRGRPSSSSGASGSGGYRLPTLATSEGGSELDDESLVDGDEEAGKKMDVGAGVGIGGEMDEERRASIAFSVMKVKGGNSSKEVVLLEQGEGGAEGGNGEEVEGLGVGLINGIKSSFVSLENQQPTSSNDTSTNENEDLDGDLDQSSSTSTSSHPTSTSPSPKRRLVTPGPNDLPTSSDVPSSGPMVIIREGNGRTSRSSSGSGSGRGLLNIQEIPLVKTKGEMEYTPTFASIAHTPEQLKEIARMREVALRKYASENGNGNTERISV